MCQQLSGDLAAVLDVASSRNDGQVVDGKGYGPRLSERSRDKRNANYERGKDFHNYYFAKICEGSPNALNSSAFPLGSKKNIVACSPTSLFGPAAVYGFAVNSNLAELFNMGSAGQPAGNTNSWLIPNLPASTAFTNLYNRTPAVDAANTRSVTEAVTGAYAQVDANGHLGNMRDVSPISPWFRLQVGYELLDWLMLFGQGDVALSSTSLAHRPPAERTYALFGAGGGARVTWAAFHSVSFYLQGEAGVSSVTEDVLSTYGYPDADRIHPFAGGALGVEWYQLSPHYALSVSGGARDYFENFERIHGSRPPWVWFSSVAIRYAL